MIRKGILGIVLYRWAVIAFVAGALFGVPALADALVEVQRDRVLVNQGKGYRQVAGITEVKPGDLVMATETPGEGSYGYILYPECDEEVFPGKVYTVEDRPGEIDDPKSFRPLCKKAAAPWKVLGAAAVPLIAYCISSECFDGDDRRPLPTSP